MDIKLIREQTDMVRKNLERRGKPELLERLDAVLRKDEEWRAAKKAVDDVRKERNRVSEAINEAKKAGKEASGLLEEAKRIPQQLKKREDDATRLAGEVNQLLLAIPNLIHESVPQGASDADNKVLREWGDKRLYDFALKNHVELVESLGVADFEASARASGNGFYFIKGGLAQLNMALLQFALDHMLQQGFQYIEPPLMLRRPVLAAAADTETLQNSIYDIDGEPLSLIGTSEHALLAMHTDETIPEEKLPKRYISYSMCFRKEIGAHGINEKGLWRTHQFNKVEQFIFCRPEDSYKHYEEMGRYTEAFVQALKLPYRVVEMCVGDLPSWKSKSSDIEVWRPTTQDYGELTSLSNCTDYQARKLGIKCVDKHGNRRVLHTLNNTVAATSRLMVAILETYQNKDGTVTVPDVLVPYMRGMKTIEKL